MGQSYSKKADTEDPLSLKPRPDTMSKTMTTDEIDVAEDGTIIDAKSKKYVVPKFSATVMEEEAKSNRQKREEDRNNKRILKGEFIRGLQENYGDAPVEIKNSYTHDEKEDEEEKRRRRYEEDNFIRLQQTKQEKKLAKQKEKKIQFGEDFGDLTEFEKIGAYFKREQAAKERAQDAKDMMMRKTLAANLAKRKNDRLQRIYRGIL